METSDRIKQARTAKGLSQKALAEAVGVSVQAVSQWESGKSGVSMDSMLALAKALSTDISWLMFGRKSQTEYLEDVGEVAKIPLISLRQAINFINNLKTVDDIDYAYKVFTDTSFKEEGFALHVYEDVYGEGMRRGDLLVFDTGESPVPGDIVIAVIARAKDLEAETAPFAQSLFSTELLEAEQWITRDDTSPKNLKFRPLRKGFAAQGGDLQITWIVGTLVERRTYSRRSDQELANLKSWLTPD